MKEIRDIDDAITTWENKVKRLEAEYNEKLSETLKVAVVTSMMPPVMQDFIYTNVDDSSKYSVMVAKVRSWASNKMAMMSGPAPMDVGEVYSSSWTQDQNFAEEEWDEAEVQAVGPSTQCHRCGGWGHLARDCATSQGKSKGGKDTFGRNYRGADHQKGKSKGNSKGVGKGSDGKGKGKGYQGTCWKCGVVGHKAHECTNPGQYPNYQRQANNIEEGGTEDIDVGGIWMIGNVDAEDWVEVPPGLGKRWTRSARTTRTGTSVSNRYELLADHSDDGHWGMMNAGISDDEERVNVVAGREYGWKLHRKVDVEVGAVESGITRVKSRERGMRFNVARVQKPLASAAKVVEAGNKISMGPNPDDNYIMNDATGEKIALRIDRGTFVFDVEFQDGEVGTITLDSGAGVNVWPENLQSHVPMMAKDPRLRMTAANGTNIDNLGTKIIKFQVSSRVSLGKREGLPRRDHG